MITIDDLDDLLNKLGSMERIQTTLGAPMMRSLALLQRDMSRNVAKSPGAFTRKAKPSQRRAYWAKVRENPAMHREGIGYVRTRNLANRWTSEVQPLPNGWRGILGSNMSYAPYVYQAAQPGGQQPFHAESGFPTDEATMDKHAAQIGREFEAAILRELLK